MSNAPLHPRWKGECLYCDSSKKHLYITDVLYDYLNTLILLGVTEGRWNQLPECWTRPMCWQWVYSVNGGIHITVEYLGIEDKPDTHRNWKINIEY